MKRDGFRHSLETRLEQLQARAIIPTPDEQCSLEALRPRVPELHCMPGGEDGRQSHVVVGGREITDTERDRTRRDEQRVKERDHVILRASMLHEALGESQFLIATSLQPENARVEGIEQRALVVLIQDPQQPSRGDARTNQWLKMSSRAKLVSQDAQRLAEESAPDRHIGTIGRPYGDGVERLAETEGDPILARGESIGIEPGYRSQPVPSVINDLGKLESLLERGVRILEADRARCPRRRLASDLQAGVAKCEIQAHVAAWIAGYPASEAGDGLLDSRAAFRRQQQMHPQRHCGRGEGHADVDIPARRKGPVEGRAQVVDVGPVRHQPLGDRPRLQLGLGLLEKVAIVLGVASRDDLDFRPLDELLTRVRAGRLEEAIRYHRAADIGRQERLANQVRDGVLDVRSGSSTLAATAVAASSVKAPAKIPNRRRTTRSDSESSS